MTVTLTGTTGNGTPVTLTTTTNGVGEYLFSGLVPGTYKLTFTTPGGYTATGQDLGGDDTKDSDVNPATGMTINEVLISGETNLTYDAGYYQPASIGNFVWNDLDGNGIQNAGEPGISGVTVTLTGTTGTGASVTLTTTTNGIGEYLFSNLVPGTYKLTFTTPGGYTTTGQDLGGDDTKDSDVNPSTGMTINEVLTSGENNLTYDAGYYQPASIGNFVWNDLDGNGVQNAGEPGISGVTVTLTGTTGTGASVTLTTTTNGVGEYLFSNLVPGTYKLTFTTPGGYTTTGQDLGGDDTKDSDVNPSTGMTINEVLTSGENNLTYDAGYYQPASIGNFVWNDINANGIQDAGEAGIAGVTVTLTGTTGAGTSVTLTTTTNGVGEYLFANLVPGTYKLTFTTPGGYTTTGQDLGGDDTKDSDVNPSTGMTINEVLVSGETNLTYDAGYFQSTSIGNFVWNDLDGNGIQNAGEPGIPGVTVTLTGTTGGGASVTLTTTTNGIGEYLFSNLQPGTYKLTFTTPAGYTTTGQDLGGDDTKDSDVNPSTGMTINEVLTSGEQNLTYDAGYYQPASIGNFVWNDLDGNGIQNAGEPGISGVTVTLTGTTGTGASVTLTTTTNGVGEYLFSNLVPGTYKLTFTTPGGYTTTGQDLGGDDTKDSDVNPSTGMTINEVLTSGENNLTYDAGYYQPASIGNFVWNDLDGNGVQNAGEPGISGVSVTLTGTTGTGASVTLTTTTNGVGEYLFSNLVPGTYKLTFTTPGGYTTTGQDLGGDDTKDSDVNPSTGMTINEVLTSGENNLTYDAGYYQPASIGNFVWNDQDGNGIQNAGEPGISGVTVTLTGTTGAGVSVTLTTTTNGVGEYLFSNLVPGTYKLTFTTPGGYTVTGQDLGGDDTKDSDVNPSTGMTINEVLTSGENNLTYDAGYYQPASIGNFVWNDLDGNGIQNAGEPGISGVTVTLTGTTGTGASVTLTTTTNGIGEYLFTNLVPGTYKLTFTTPAGYTVTGQDLGGDDTKDSDVNPITGMTINEVLVSGENNLTYDAGYYQPASIGNFVWNDLDADGIQDAGEPGIPGVTVTLTGTTGTGQSVTLTTATNSIGEYLFSNLVPGTYKLTFTTPATFTPTPQDQGGDDTKDSDANIANGMTINEVLNSGENNLTYDAGYYVPAAIGDFVWYDLNKNGLQDAGEPGVPSQTVTLTGTTGSGISVNLTTLTGATGAYLFSNLQPGTYKITFSSPGAQYTATTQDVGSNDAIDSDANVGTLMTINEVLTSGETNLTYDAGFITNINLTTVVVNVNCYNAQNGSIDLSVTGGTAPYTYLWSNSATTQDLSGLAPGTYTVTVTDALGFTASTSATVTEPPVLVTSATTGNVSCFGGSNGNIDLSVSGGSPGYTYLWSNGATTQDLTGLTVGTYTVTVTDTKGCTKVFTATITQPTPIVLSVNITNVLCFGGNNGAIDLTVTGGTPAYTYLWSNSATTMDISNLTAGVYTVTVTDTKGCTKTITGTVEQPTVLGASTTVTNVLCYNGNNGAIDLTVTGGTQPYIYAWSNSATTQDLSNLTAGTYTVTITDAHGCTKTTVATVTQPTEVILTKVITNVLCFGGNNGAVDLSVTGGTGAYTYLWSNGASTQDINTLTAGTYTVTVTDANGCSKTTTATVTQPALLTLSTQVTNPSCYGGNTGSIDLTVTGGTTAYTYLWSNGATTQDLANIGGGTYTVTVTDANGCTAIKSATVNEIQAISLSTAVTNVLCNGNNTGAINLTVTGGTPAFTYLWSNLAVTEDLNNIPAGTYTVTVTDANQCVASTTTIVTQPTALVTSFTVVNQLCNGGSNGSINLTVSGGTPNYNYIWSNGITTQDQDNLPAGTYVVTVTDANGCSKVVTATITEPTSITLTTVPTNVSCPGGSNGAVDLTVTGGTPSYTYIWSNNSTTQDINNLTAGTYGVVVTDANGCQASTSTQVTQPDPIVLTAQITNVACNGGNSGAIVLTVTGGTPAYTYLWSTGATTKNIANLVAGIYTVTVTDSKGCTKVKESVVEEATSLAITGVVTNVSCFGGSNGAINITVTGGTPNYTYDWSYNGPQNPDTDPEDITNRTAGVYTVTVTDANGCSKIATFTIGQPTVLNPTLTVTNVSCFQGSNGAINLNVSGGTPGYTYAWSNSATTQNINNLSAGVYTVTITDQNGCTKTASATVTQPNLLTANGTITNVSCFNGNNGAITLTVNGGTTPYTFLWSNGANTQNISNLIANTYTVTVTDSKGCTAIYTGTVTQPTVIELSATSTPVVACTGGSNGTIDLTVIGGTPAYTYVWSNGATTQDLSGLTAGTYTVTVKDANNCTKVLPVVVTQLSDLSVQVSTTNVTCNGGSNGTIDITVTGGKLPYNFDWLDIPGTNNPEDRTNLPAGSYSVIVTDGNGCTAVANAVITQPTIILTTTTTPVSCFGGSNGAINLTATGGTQPYTFLWSNGQNVEDPINLIAGVYTVTVTDANGCTKTTSATITQPTALALTAVASNVSCFGGSNGSVNLTVSGGTPAYGYLWSNGATTEDLNNVVANTYTVTVTDANGCTKSITATITQPQLLVASGVMTNDACFGQANGSVDLTVTGGTPAYTYLWSNGATTQDLNNVAANTYCVTVTDSKGCTATTCVTVIQNPEIIVSTQVTNVLCNGGNNGAINLTVSGGTAPYTFLWNNGAVTEDLNNLTAGTYTVTVTDASGCTKTTSATVTQPTLVVLTATTVNVSCFGGNNGSINLSVSGGTPAYTYQWSNGQTTQDINDLTAGSYTVTVTDANGCTKSLSATITQPAPLTLGVVVSVDPPCGGSNTGNANLTVTGGTAPFSYQWSNGSTYQDLYQVDCGSYTVTVTDAKGCTKELSANIPCVPALSASAVVTPVTCYGTNTGSINQTVSGGYGGYTYQWNYQFASTEDLVNIPAGIYDVTITDIKGCTLVKTYIVGGPSQPITINGVVGNASCGQANGSIDISVFGGSPAYSYLWSNTATTQDVTNLAAGTYTVTVTDSKGCTKTKSFDILGSGGLNVTATATAATCGGSNGTVTTSVTGATGNFTYLWNTGATTANLTGLAAGTYCVTVTGTNGCTGTACATVQSIGGPTLTVATTNVTCFGGTNGAVNLSVANGTAPYTYLWSNGATTQDLNNVAANTYCVTVTDAGGCIATICATVTQPTVLALTATTTAATCGNQNGTVTLAVTGGTPNYTYQWSNGSTTQNLTALAAGTYCVTVTDANGCTKTTCATVIQTGGPTLSTAIVNTTCGNNNGAINLTATGGATPYTYLWTNGATTEDLSNLAAGTYCVTVTEASGCTATACATIAPSVALTATASSTPAGCGVANGTITVVITGGQSAPYTYNWSNGGNSGNGSAQTSPFTIANLNAGTYSITITGTNGCTAVVNVVVSQSSGISATASTTPVSCFGGSNGVITVDVTNGTPNYAYNWNNGVTTGQGNGIANEPFNINNVTAGTYSITVTDGNGCSVILSAVVGTPTQLTLSTTTTPSTCGNTNGSVTLTVSGGTPGYTFLWTNGAITQNLSGLAAGTYCVTVTDSKGCTKTVCATVEQTGGPTLAVTSVSENCFGGSTGAVNLTVTGGTQPYTYLWNYNNTTTKNLNNVPAGTYCVTVTAANGCTSSICATVTQPSVITPITNVVAANCGVNNGAIDLTVTGGTPAFTYLWSNGATTQDLNNLAIGTYCVTITDSKGCTKTVCATVTCNNNNCTLTATGTQLCAPGCGQANGKIIVDVAGGTAPYTFEWTNTVNGSVGDGGPTSDDPILIMGLASGTYSITITDVKGCTAVTNVTVDQPTGMMLTALPVCATLCGGSDGKIIIDVLNGVPGFTYNWTNTNGQSGTGQASTEPFEIKNLAAGTYTIIVTGADGCSGTVTTIVTHLSLLNATATSTGISCNGTNGTISIAVNNGAGPYKYNWVNSVTSGNGTAATQPFTIQNVAAGTYNITITDANGCVAITSVTVGGNLGGIAFNDYNTNGAMGIDETGLANIKVFLYECGNPDPVDSMLTGDDGYFLFNGLDNYPYRIEFVPTQSFLVPSFHGPANGTTVQFIDQANCGISVGFYNPDDYCQDKPNVAFTTFTQGLADLVTSTSVGLFPYDAVNPDNIFGQVPANDKLGSVYGLAWDRTNKYLYASAFLKRHVGLGELGLGGIYRIEYVNGVPAVTPLYEVPNVGSVDRPDLSTKSTPSKDSDVFAKIGKAGLGDIDLSSDYKTLWTVNLNTRNLVKISNIQGTPSSIEIPIESAPNCNNGVFRPLGLKVYKGKVYVGGVCTGENNGSGDDLSSSIHEYDIASGQWKKVLDFELTGSQYNHGDIIGNVNANMAQCREWETWVDTYSERNWVGNTGAGEPAAIVTAGNFEVVGGGLTGAEFRCRGQAMVSDIEMTREGLMVIGLMDRTGHQLGYRQFRPTTSAGNPISAASGGDILMAYDEKGIWRLESNGKVPGINRTSLYGVGNNEGPFGGEFFFDNTRSVHQDADAGGLVYVPGKTEVLGVIVSPNTSEYTIGGGVAYYDLINGSNTRIDLTIVDPVFNQVGIGKANSMGDLEALCDDAPLQLGNRVWADKNCDGVQDACEAPIPGVWVSLYDANSGILLANTKTDSLGEYYFTGLGTPGENWIVTAAFDSVKPNYNYKIVFGTDGTTKQFNIAEGKLKLPNKDYTLTVANAGAGHYPDLNDSDAEIANASGKAWDKLPTIMYTTGAAGHTDHSLDAGFCPEGITLTACENIPNAGTALFDLNNANILVDPAGTHVVTYHATQAGAQAGSIALTNPHLGANNDIIYARVSNTNGSVLSIESIKLKVAATPIAYVAQLQVCPNAFDGTTATFNLHNADAQVANGVAGLKVTYYDSYSLAEQGLLPLSFTYTSVTKNIWARLENEAGCFDIDIVQLLVLPSPGVVLLPDDATCSGAANGKINAIVVNGPAQYTFNWSNGVTQGPTANPFTTLTGLLAGTYTVTLTDGNGCTVASKTTVDDGVPFAILPINDLGPICPGSTVAPLTLVSSIYGANYSWTGGAAVGLVNGTASSAFPVIPGFTAKSGVATITVTATFGQCSDTEQYTINAIDEIAPTFLNCPTQMIMVACDGTGGPGCSAKVNWADPAAIDNCGVPTVVQTSGPPSGSQIPAGDPITIVYTATDGSGNTSICSFQVMVVDMAPPQFAISMPQNATVNCDAVPAMLQLMANQVIENCSGAVKIVQTEASTQDADEANSKHYNYTITRKWVVTDANNNAASHVQVLTVKDVTAPTALCKNVTMELGQNGTASITPAMINNGTSDNCAPAANLAVSIGTFQFNLSNLGANNVPMLVTDPSGNVGNCVSVVTITSSQVPPVAAFNAQPTPTCEGPFTVKFSDASIGSPTAWLWSFPGGTPATSTESSPSVTYQTAGDYMATLKVTNAQGVNTVAKQTHVAAMTNPTAVYNFTKNGGTVTFVNTSVQAEQYMWNFGDGTTSTEANPTHTYAQNGTYFVLLSAMNGCGSSVLQKTVSITNTTGVQDANWLEQFNLYPNPNTGAYTVEVIGKPAQEITFTLYNAIGQVVRYESADFKSGTIQQLFNYSDLPGGMYTLGVQSGDQVKYVKVVIQH